MMLKKILIFSILLMSSAFADEAADKAEFKKLYAEFNDLYANSEDIKPIIEVATKLYEIAPKTYGRFHMNTAVVTYNLAALYDEAGGTHANSSERKAVELYKKYFKILDRLNTPKDASYLEQYKKFVIAEFNNFNVSSNHKYAENALKLAYSINLSSLEIADFEYLIAYQRFITEEYEKALHDFMKAKDYYIHVYGENNAKVGRSIQYIATINLKNNNFEVAEENYLKAIDIYQKMEPQIYKMTNDAFLGLSSIYLQQKRFDDIDTLRLHLIETGAYADDLEYLPIVRFNPSYPSVAAENG
ncbi:tetratricopeptide repeat protein [Emcibacteraceae bacterium]|nr:tetratricopeptide repeat protein [Emcibacteraceae bacterium]MDC1090149.1 tetratricopeptide repeat protein [Emcibacteraceae bacterium]